MSERKTTDLIIIHCAATTSTMDVDAEWIKKIHIQRGFRTIGYHFFIKRDGTIEVGRGVDEVGAHAYGKNGQSVGICLAGGVNEQNEPEDNFTDEQMKALTFQVELLLQRYPHAKVIGHYEVGNKACPSFNVEAWRAENIEQYKNE